MENWMRIEEACSQWFVMGSDEKITKASMASLKYSDADFLMMLGPTLTHLLSSMDIF
jgi:hypothetical protein